MKNPKMTVTELATINTRRCTIDRVINASPAGVGGRRISSPSSPSMIKFTVTVPSVTMLIHKICTAASGSGYPISSANSKTATSSTEVTNKNKTTFFRF